MADFGSAGLSFSEGVMRGFDFVDRIQGRKQERQDRADAKARQSMLDDREQERYQQGLSHQAANESYQRGRDTMGDLERSEAVKREETRHQEVLKRDDRDYSARRGDVAFERSKEELAHRHEAAAYTWASLRPLLETPAGRITAIGAGHFSTTGQVPEEFRPGVTAPALLDYANSLYGPELERGASTGSHGPGKFGSIHIDPKTGDLLLGLDHEPEPGKKERIGRRVKGQLASAQLASVGALAEALNEAPDDATRKQMLDQAEAQIGGAAIEHGVPSDRLRTIFARGLSDKTKGELGTAVDYIAQIAKVDQATALKIYKDIRTTAKPEDLAGKLMQQMVTTSGTNTDPKDVEKKLTALMAIHKRLKESGSEGGPGPATAAPGDTTDTNDFVNGQIYEDASGNKALFNNGQWEPQ